MHWVNNQVSLSISLLRPEQELCTTMHCNYASVLLSICADLLCKVKLTCIAAILTKLITVEIYLPGR